MLRIRNESEKKKHIIVGLMKVLLQVIVHNENKISIEEFSIIRIL